MTKRLFDTRPNKARFLVAWYLLPSHESRTTATGRGNGCG